MRLLTASLAFAILLSASLAGKGFGLKETGRASPDDDRAVLYLEERGLTVNSAAHYATSIWTVATRGACRVRIATVSPEGWSRAIVEQTAGEHLTYAFDGRLYAEQPVMRTMLENYRRRLLRYFGNRPPDLQIRAISISQGCPPDLLRSEDALRLSQ
jgi:hypothetical protein